MQSGFEAEARWEVCLWTRWRRIQGAQTAARHTAKKVVLAALLGSGRFKYALATDQSCLESDQPLLTGPEKNKETSTCAEDKRDCFSGMAVNSEK